MTKIYITAVLFLFAFAACKSAQKMYDRGNYAEAIERSIRKLQKEPNDATAKSILKDAYREAVARQEGEIRTVLNSASENRYEQAYRQYANLQQLYHSVQQVPAAARAVAATDYASFVETYRNKAADVRLERAEKWMDDETITGYREAYREYQAAQRLKPNDVDIKKQVQYALDMATLKILVVPIDLQGSNYYYSNSSYQMRNFQDRLVRKLNIHSGSEFVRFITEWEGRSRDIVPDEILEMRMSRLVIGRPYDQSETRTVQKEVVVKETVYKKDSVVKEYATVKARIATTRRMLVSEASLFLTTRDAGGRILWNDEFRGEHRREAKFVTYTGDERALSNTDKELIKNNKPEDIRVPREDEIVEDLMQQIESDLAQRLRQHYQRSF
ncbi:hypothetical protein [Paracnuella aquatica]|uniref:hypothetical protein n=1 Tax=Paracnuella aquatica TaxID=2268757 RepID=UPI000DEF8BA3|nr:hypothetical protein [Paracnuella aquatica]RPD50583.1 hypothetical protein DRJ53_06565 [Paracnuella aquatica]